MLTAVITLGVLCAGLIVALLWSTHQHASELAAQQQRFHAERQEVIGQLLAARAEQDREAAEERRELLNRVQRPEYVPTAPIEGWTMPEVEDDELELVGTIQSDLPESQPGSVE